MKAADVSFSGGKSVVLGKLDPAPLSPERKKQEEQLANNHERTDYPSTIGSLLWISTQSRPDLSF